MDKRMDSTVNEVSTVSGTNSVPQIDLPALADLELALVGGGIGDTVL